MDDAELRAIRQARMAELQKNAGGDSSGSGAAQQQSAAAAGILNQILETEARERLSRVRMVRPDRAEAVESYIIRLFSTGQINKKLSERDIVEMLDGISRDTQSKKQTKIVYDRKHVDVDDEDDDDDFFD
ncbi:uncharacterized protein LODBEIA_P14830 [Lodderomyces beijingensis]|uniref:Programmed cell death protein 5 n=1 Tax=Lodderomyces beijingensis TaxID=1775926 RepID=A0ABP0ZGH0_9ASCO